MIAEVPWGEMDDIADERTPGPIERLIAAEAAWLAIPPRRRPAAWSATLVGLRLAWDASVLGYTPKLARPCPACADHPIGRCLVCSASGDDPSQWPLMDLHERSRILAGPPLRKRVAKARTRRERRATAPRRASA